MAKFLSPLKNVFTSNRAVSRAVANPSIRTIAAETPLVVGPSLTAVGTPNATVCVDDCVPLSAQKTCGTMGKFPVGIRGGQQLYNRRQAPKIVWPTPEAYMNQATAWAPFYSLDGQWTAWNTMEPGVTDRPMLYQLDLKPTNWAESGSKIITVDFLFQAHNTPGGWVPAPPAAPPNPNTPNPIWPNATYTPQRLTGVWSMDIEIYVDAAGTSLYILPCMFNAWTGSQLGNGVKIVPAPMRSFQIDGSRTDLINDNPVENGPFNPLGPFADPPVQPVVRDGEERGPGLAAANWTGSTTIDGGQLNGWTAILSAYGSDNSFAAQWAHQILTNFNGTR